ncbi:hypothetical protein PQX77_006921 [Marasmius sp. AFHP31]|nr:hypothetical protein PQX77_006921 [Marasmius sp. AFHP31]
MRLWKTSQTAAEDPRECPNSRCTPPPFHEPRRGTNPDIGDIVCIRISALVPFYHLLGDTNDRACKPGDRPCIITSIRSDGTFNVCLMATFDKNSYDELPAVIKEFIILVPATNRSDDATLNPRFHHIHTTPEWQIPGSGERGSQYLITLPIIASLKPFKKWRTSDMPLDAGFFLDATTVSKLDDIILDHDKRSKEWLAENGGIKASGLLQSLRALERTYKSGNRAAEGDRVTPASRRTCRTRGTQSALSAGFTPFANGGTEDVDGFIVVGADGKKVKPKSRRSRAASSRAPSAIASFFTSNRQVR